MHLHILVYISCFEQSQVFLFLFLVLVQKRYYDVCMEAVIPEDYPEPVMGAGFKHSAFGTVMCVLLYNSLCIIINLRNEERRCRINLSLCV